ncbi:hypothetical protein Tco_1439921 [Tanacetum coccineum]
MANVTSLLTSLCDNFKSSASTSNPGTLPSQTVTNPRQQINAITTRSGKTLEEPSIPLVPTPDVSISQNEPNPETSTEKVQNPNLENTAHVPPPGEEDSIFIEIPKPKAKKTVNLDPNPNSYQSKLPYPERMKMLLSKCQSLTMVKRVVRNKEKLEEIAISTVNAGMVRIILNKVPRKLEIRENLFIHVLYKNSKGLVLSRFSAALIFLPYFIYNKLELKL